jgi:hypothetical protein
MFEQKRLVFFRGQDIARDQVALFSPAPGKIGLQEAQSLSCVTRVDRSQNMFAMDA